MSDITGFPPLPFGDARLQTYTVVATAIKLTLRRDVAPILLGVATDFHRLVESLILNKCGGHNYRYIAGTTMWSRHARGIAIDLNWSKHPLGAEGTFSNEDEKVIHSILTKYSYQGKRLVRWGGDYSGRKDEMHFELDQPLAFCLAAVKALQTPRVSLAHKAGSRTLKLTTPQLRGDDVRYVQRFIGGKHAGTADGIYGPATVAGVRWYQDMRGIAVDGVVGRTTWRHMGVEAIY